MRLGTVCRKLKALATDTSGSTAAYVGLAILTLVIATGAATDVGQAISVRTQLQRAADSAALAGASAYTSSSTASAATTAATNFMNGAIAQLRSSANVTFNVALSTTTASGSVTDYAVTVTASATVKPAVSQSLTNLVKTSVTATADNPVYSVKISLSAFSSSAADGDAIYVYVVPAERGTPTSTTQIFNNFNANCIRSLSIYGKSSYYNSAASSTASSYVTIPVTAGQSIGFSLVNITGCNSAYLLNGHLSLYMNVNTFYSHMSPPSVLAYPLVSTNCALQVSTSSTPATGCFSTTPSLGAFNCKTAGTTPYTFFWNDMGGLIDDNDYNDAVYKVACSSAGSGYTGVVLIN